MANEKKATVRDIAAKAGVSVATVSYVLNDKKDTKISDVTRKKVLQVANLLNYSIPEKYKNADVKQGVYTIGVMYELKQDTPSRNMEIMSIINLLAERFIRIGFSFRLIPIESETELLKPVQGLDGIIAIDLENESFKQMSNQYFIPILCLDMIINDFLFYQIHTDMEALASQAKEILGDDFYIVTDKYNNEGYRDYIASAAQDDHIMFFSELAQNGFSKVKNKKLLVFGIQSGITLKEFSECKDIVVVTNDTTPEIYSSLVKTIHHDIEKKANLAMNIMMNALERKFDVKHEYKI